VADPAVASKIFLPELRPWGPVEWERHIKK
jgi:hypothetical protein